MFVNLCTTEQILSQNRNQIRDYKKILSIYSKQQDPFKVTCW